MGTGGELSQLSLRETGAGSGPIPEWILVADDDNGVRDLWTVVLTRAGYRVLAARNGREALELIRAVVPDLIILDLHMPEMDGPTFLKALEGAPVLRSMPVLIVSGFLEDDSPRASLGLNIVGRLSKPVRQADFLAAVQTALAPAPRPR
jgi:CheY-like chemotaxis protein